MLHSEQIIEAARPLYEARIAHDAATRADAYALRYDCYLDGGHIAPNPDRQFRDRFDDLPTSTTIVLYDRGRPVGSVRACMLRRGAGTPSPAREVFPDEVEALLVGSGPPREGYDGLEINRLVCSPLAPPNDRLVFMLLRLVGWLGLKADFRVAVCCVRGHHLPLYRRLGYREESGPRAYPGLSCPMSLLSLRRHDYDRMRTSFVLMNPEIGPPGALEALETGALVRPYAFRERRA